MNKVMSHISVVKEPQLTITNPNKHRQQWVYWSAVHVPHNITFAAKSFAKTKFLHIMPFVGANVAARQFSTTDIEGLCDTVHLLSQTLSWVDSFCWYFMTFYSQAVQEKMTALSSNWIHWQTLYNLSERTDKCDMLDCSVSGMWL